LKRICAYTFWWLRSGLHTDTVILEKQGSTPIVRPQRHGGWHQYFADASTALPEDFELPDDPPPEPVEL
jgi:hypothetical protein